MEDGNKGKFITLTQKVKSKLFSVEYYFFAVKSMMESSDNLRILARYPAMHNVDDESHSFYNLPSSHT